MSELNQNLFRMIGLIALIEFAIYSTITWYGTDKLSEMVGIDSILLIVIAIVLSLAACIGIGIWYVAEKKKRNLYLRKFGERIKIQEISTIPVGNNNGTPIYRISGKVIHRGNTKKVTTYKTIKKEALEVLVRGAVHVYIDPVKSTDYVIDLGDIAKDVL